MIRKHYRFQGRVQGVGFRFTLYRYATQYGLTGWVKNCYDGSVEACLQGSLPAIKKVIDCLYHERFIYIDHIDEEDLDVLASECSFEVKY